MLLSLAFTKYILNDKFVLT